MLELLLEAAEAEETFLNNSEEAHELSGTPPKFGGKFYGAWADMTDEEMNFFRSLRAENNSDRNSHDLDLPRFS